MAWAILITTSSRLRGTFIGNPVVDGLTVVILFAGTYAIFALILQGVATFLAYCVRRAEEAEAAARPKYYRFLGARWYFPLGSGRPPVCDACLSDMVCTTLYHDSMETTEYVCPQCKTKIRWSLLERHCSLSDAVHSNIMSDQRRNDMSNFGFDEEKIRF